MRYLLLLILISVGCKKEEKTIESYQLYKPTREKISKSLTLAGRVEPATKATITAPLGSKIKTLKVGLGQKVNKGDLLLQYDETALAQEVSKAKTAIASREADLKNMEIQLEAAKKKLDRAKMLYARKIGPQSDVEEAERDYTTQTNSIKARRMEVGAERVQMQKTYESIKTTEIRSPISGIVTFLWLGNEAFSPGTAVKEGDKIITISGFDKYVIDTRVAESDVSKLSANLRVAISLEAIEGATYEGKIATIAPTPEVDQATGLAFFSTRIEFLKPDERVRFGMSTITSVELTSTNDALVVPLNAVKYDGTQEFVEVVENGVIEKRNIKLGMTSDISAEILQGLKEGEAVKVP